MSAAAASRTQLARTLQTAYADGLISQRTLSLRLDQVLHSRLVEPGRLVGDLYLRSPTHSFKDSISQTMNTVIGRLGGLFGDLTQDTVTLLALDWSAEPRELLVGRSSRCDVVISEMSVSGRRALPRPGSPQGRLIRRAVSSAQLSSAQGRPERPGERSRVDGRSGPIRSAGRHNDIRLAATSQDFKRSGLPTGPWLWAPATRS